jgi:hypothetical protein
MAFLFKSKKNQERSTPSREGGPPVSATRIAREEKGARATPTGSLNSLDEGSPGPDLEKYAVRRGPEQSSPQQPPPQAQQQQQQPPPPPQQQQAPPQQQSDLPVSPNPPPFYHFLLHLSADKRTLLTAMDYVNSSATTRQQTHPQTPMRPCFRGRNAD